MKDKKWGAVKRNSCRRYDDMMMGSVVGLPLAKKSAAHRCALQRVSERCATLLTMDTAKLWKPLTRVCDGMLLGAPASISSQGCCARQQWPRGRCEERLDKIEAL